MPHLWPQLVRRLMIALAVVSVSVVAATLTAQMAPTSTVFGQNVIVFNPSMSASLIQSTVNAIAAQQVSNQFGPQRVALLFEPGTYGTAAAPLNFQVGYYTEVSGLGAQPGDVVINGSIDVYNQCFGSGNCIALDNFWRSLSNLTINVVSPAGAGCYSGEFWAVSQGSPMRHVGINSNGANVTLMDYCTSPSYASGGFLADVRTDANVINGSQQQYYVRNSVLGGWTNGVWNQVFSGVVGAPSQSYPNPTYTTLPSTPVSRERPYLVGRGQKYGVFVPAAQQNSSGASWSATSSTAGKLLPLGRFFIATPKTSVAEINLALLFGKNLLLTPGVYQLQGPIVVEHPGTVVLGLGFATLVPQNGTEALAVADVDDVTVAGLIFDAGPKNSPVLLKMGFGAFGLPLPRGGLFQHANKPSLVSDVFFRIGGATAGMATTSLEVDSSDVIVDDIWAWRADHGNGVGWTMNTAEHGVVVNGDRVVATGLAVEHYQKQQVEWNGNGGETIFYQSELPYDPPSQAAWMDGAANGYPSYVVSDSVHSHQAFGLGIYSYFNQGVNIVEDNAITVPLSGTTVIDAGTVFLNGGGQITHVVNGVGNTASASDADQLQTVTAYP